MQSDHPVRSELKQHNLVEEKQKPTQGEINISGNVQKHFQNDHRNMQVLDVLYIG